MIVNDVGGKKISNVYWDIICRALSRYLKKALTSYEIKKKKQGLEKKQVIENEQEK